MAVDYEGGLVGCAWRETVRCLVDVGGYSDMGRGYVVRRGADGRKQYYRRGFWSAVGARKRTPADIHAAAVS